MAILNGARLSVLRKNSDGVIRDVLIRTNQIKFGSEMNCTVRLKSELAEKLHCKIFVKNDKIFIANYSSKNPISVDGKVIQKRAIVNDGCVIEICGTRFRWTFDASVLHARAEKVKKSDRTPTSSKFGKPRRTTMVRKKQIVDQTKPAVGSDARKSGPKKSQKTPTYTLPKNNKQLLKNIKKRFTMHSVMIGHNSDDDEEMDGDEHDQNESNATESNVDQDVIKTPRKLAVPDTSKNDTPFYTPDLEKENQTPVMVGKTPRTPKGLNLQLENSAMMILSYTPVIGPRSKANVAKTPLSSAKKATHGLRSGFLTPKNDNIPTVATALNSPNVSKVGNSMYLIDLTTPSSNNSSYASNGSDQSFASLTGLIDLTTPPSKKTKTPASAVAKSSQKGLLRSALKNASRTPLSALRTRHATDTPKQVAKPIFQGSVSKSPKTPAKGIRTPQPPRSQTRSQKGTPVIPATEPSQDLQTLQEHDKLLDKSETPKETPVMTTDELFDTLVGRPSIKKTYSRKSDSPKKLPFPLIVAEDSNELPKTDVDSWVESVVAASTSPEPVNAESFMKKPNRTTQVRSSQYSDITPHESFTDVPGTVTTEMPSTEESQENTDLGEVSAVVSEGELEKHGGSNPALTRKSHTPLASKIVRSLGNKRQTIGNFFTNMFGKLTVSPVTRVSITDETSGVTKEVLDRSTDHESELSGDEYHDSESDQQVEYINPSPKLRQSLRDTRKLLGNALTSLNTSKLTLDNTADIDESLLLNETYDNSSVNKSHLMEDNYDLTDLSGLPETATITLHDTPKPSSSTRKSTKKSVHHDYRSEISPTVNDAQPLTSRSARRTRTSVSVATPSARRNIRKTLDVDISPLAVPLQVTPVKESRKSDTHGSMMEQEVSTSISDEPQQTPVRGASENIPVDTSSENSASAIKEKRRSSKKAIAQKSVKTGTSVDESVVYSDVSENVTPQRLRLSRSASRRSTVNNAAKQLEPAEESMQDKLHSSADVSSVDHTINTSGNASITSLTEQDRECETVETGTNASVANSSVVCEDKPQQSINLDNSNEVQSKRHSRSSVGQGIVSAEIVEQTTSDHAIIEHETSSHVSRSRRATVSLSTNTEPNAEAILESQTPSNKRNTRKSLAVTTVSSPNVSQRTSTVPLSESNLSVRGNQSVQELLTRSPLQFDSSIDDHGSSPFKTVTETPALDEGSDAPTATGDDEAADADLQEQSTLPEVINTPVRRGRSSLRRNQPSTESDRLSASAGKPVRKPAKGTPLLRKAIFAMCTPSRSSGDSDSSALQTMPATTDQLAQMKTPDRTESEPGTPVVAESPWVSTPIARTQGRKSVMGTPIAAPALTENVPETGSKTPASTRKLQQIISADENVSIHIVEQDAMPSKEETKTESLSRQSVKVGTPLRETRTRKSTVGVRQSLARTENDSLVPDVSENILTSELPSVSDEVTNESIPVPTTVEHSPDIPERSVGAITPGSGRKFTPVQGQAFVSSDDKHDASMTEPKSVTPSKNTSCASEHTADISEIISTPDHSIPARTSRSARRSTTITPSVGSKSMRMSHVADKRDTMVEPLSESLDDQPNSEHEVSELSEETSVVIDNADDTPQTADRSTRRSTTVTPSVGSKSLRMSRSADKRATMVEQLSESLVDEPNSSITELNVSTPSKDTSVVIENADDASKVVLSPEHINPARTSRATRKSTTVAPSTDSKSMRMSRSADKRATRVEQLSESLVDQQNSSMAEIEVSTPPKEPSVVSERTTDISEIISTPDHSTPARVSRSSRISTTVTPSVGSESLRMSRSADKRATTVETLSETLIDQPNSSLAEHEVSAPSDQPNSSIKELKVLTSSKETSVAIEHDGHAPLFTPEHISPARTSRSTRRSTINTSNLNLTGADISNEFNVVSSPKQAEISVEILQASVSASPSIIRTPRASASGTKISIPAASIPVSVMKTLTYERKSLSISPSADSRATMAEQLSESIADESVTEPEVPSPSEESENVTEHEQSIKVKTPVRGSLARTSTTGAKESIPAQKTPAYASGNKIATPAARTPAPVVKTTASSRKSLSSKRSTHKRATVAELASESLTDASVAEAEVLPPSEESFMENENVTEHEQSSKIRTPARASLSRTSKVGVMESTPARQNTVDAEHSSPSKNFNVTPSIQSSEPISSPVTRTPNTLRRNETSCSTPLPTDDGYRASIKTSASVKKLLPTTPSITGSGTQSSTSALHKQTHDSIVDQQNASIADNTSTPEQRSSARATRSARRSSIVPDGNVSVSSMSLAVDEQSEHSDSIVEQQDASTTGAEIFTPSKEASVVTGNVTSTSERISSTRASRSSRRSTIAPNDSQLECRDTELDVSNVAVSIDSIPNQTKPSTEDLQTSTSASPLVNRTPRPRGSTKKNVTSAGSTPMPVDSEHVNSAAAPASTRKSRSSNRRSTILGEPSGSVVDKPGASIEKVDVMSPSTDSFVDSVNVPEHEQANETKTPVRVSLWRSSGIAASANQATNDDDRGDQNDESIAIHTPRLRRSTSKTQTPLATDPLTDVERRTSVRTPVSVSKFLLTESPGTESSTENTSAKQSQITVSDVEHQDASITELGASTSDGTSESAVEAPKVATIPEQSSLSVQSDEELTGDSKEPSPPMKHTPRNRGRLSKIGTPASAQKEGGKTPEPVRKSLLTTLEGSTQHDVTHPEHDLPTPLKDQLAIASTPEITHDSRNPEHVTPPALERGFKTPRPIRGTQTPISAMKRTPTTTRTRKSVTFVTPVQEICPTRKSSHELIAGNRKISCSPHIEAVHDGVLLDQTKEPSVDSSTDDRHSARLSTSVEVNSSFLNASAERHNSKARKFRMSSSTIDDHSESPLAMTDTNITVTASVIEETANQSVAPPLTASDVCPDLLKHLCERVVTLEHELDNLAEDGTSSISVQQSLEESVTNCTSDTSMGLQQLLKTPAATSTIRKKLRSSTLHTGQLDNLTDGSAENIFNSVNVQQSLDETAANRTCDTSLGLQRLLKTPAATVRKSLRSSTVLTDMSESSNFEGVEQLLKTPNSISARQPLDETAPNQTDTSMGLQQLMKTPAATSTIRKKLRSSTIPTELSESTNFEGVEQLLKTPSSISILQPLDETTANQTETSMGLQQLLKTPATRKMLRSSTIPIELSESSKLEGVEQLLKSPSLISVQQPLDETAANCTVDTSMGIQQLMKTPAATSTTRKKQRASIVSSESSNFEGVEQLLKTPSSIRIQQPLDETAPNQTDTSMGLQQMLKTPAATSTTRKKLRSSTIPTGLNESSKLEGVEQLLKSPSLISIQPSLDETTANCTVDTSMGIQQLMKTPAATSMTGKKLRASTIPTSELKNLTDHSAEYIASSVIVQQSLDETAANQTDTSMGLQQLLKTPAATSTTRKKLRSSTISTEMSESTNFEGVEQLLMTPISEKLLPAPKSVSEGTPVPVTTHPVFNETVSDSLGNLGGIQQLMETSETSRGRRKRLQKNAAIDLSSSYPSAPDTTVNLEGIDQLLKTPVASSETQANVTRRTPEISMQLEGVGELMKTPVLTSASEEFPDTPSPVTVQQELTPVAAILSAERRSTRISVYSANSSSHLEGIQRLLETPTSSAASSNDASRLESTQQLHKTPAAAFKIAQSTVKDAETPIGDSSHLEGVQQIFKTPIAPLSTRKTLRSVDKTPKLKLDESSNFEGIQQMMQTPAPSMAKGRLSMSSANDSIIDSSMNLEGLDQLLKSPPASTPPVKQSAKTPILSTVSRKSLRSSTAVDHAEPDISSSSHLEGVQTLLQTPVPKETTLNETVDLRGIKQLMKTPHADTSISLDVQQLFKTPNATSVVKRKGRSATTAVVNRCNLNETDAFEGMQDLLKTPEASSTVKQPEGKDRSVQQKDETLNDTVNMEGLQQLLETPEGVQKGVNRCNLNETTDAFDGIQSLLKTPEGSPAVKKRTGKSLPIQLNDTSLNDSINMEGLQQLLETPDVQKKQGSTSAAHEDTANLEGIQQLLSTSTSTLGDVFEQNDHTANLEGLQSLLATPTASTGKTKPETIPDVKESTPSALVTNESVDLEGIQQMLETPVVASTSKNLLKRALVNRIRGTPANTSANMEGIQQLMATPIQTVSASKQKSSDDSTNGSHLEDVEQLLSTPAAASVKVDFSVTETSAEVNTPSNTRLRRKLYTKNDPEDRTPESVKSPEVHPVSSSDYLNIVLPTAPKDTKLGKKLAKSAVFDDSSDTVEPSPMEPIRKNPSRASKKNQSLAEEALAGASPELKYVKPKQPKISEEPSPITPVEIPASASSSSDSDSGQDLSAGRKRVMFNENLQIKEINSPALVGDIIQKVYRGRGRQAQRQVRVIVAEPSEPTLIKPARRATKQDAEMNNADGQSSPKLLNPEESTLAKRPRRGAKRVIEETIEVSKDDVNTQVEELVDGGKTDAEDKEATVADEPGEKVEEEPVVKRARRVVAKGRPQTKNASTKTRSKKLDAEASLDVEIRTNEEEQVELPANVQPTAIPTPELRTEKSTTDTSSAEPTPSAPELVVNVSEEEHSSSRGKRGTKKAVTRPKRETSSKKKASRDEFATDVHVEVDEHTTTQESTVTTSTIEVEATVPAAEPLNEKAAEDITVSVEPTQSAHKLVVKASEDEEVAEVPSGRAKRGTKKSTRSKQAASSKKNLSKEDSVTHTHAAVEAVEHAIAQEATATTDISEVKESIPSTTVESTSVDEPKPNAPELVTKLSDDEEVTKYSSSRGKRATTKTTTRSKRAISSRKNASKKDSEAVEHVTAQESTVTNNSIEVEASVPSAEQLEEKNLVDITQPVESTRSAPELVVKSSEDEETTKSSSSRGKRAATKTAIRSKRAISSKKGASKKDSEAVEHDATQEPVVPTNSIEVEAPLPSAEPLEEEVASKRTKRETAAKSRQRRAVATKAESSDAPLPEIQEEQIPDKPILPPPTAEALIVEQAAADSTSHDEPEPPVAAKRGRGRNTRKPTAKDMVEPVVTTKETSPMPPPPPVVIAPQVEEFCEDKPVSKPAPARRGRKTPATQVEPQPDVLHHTTVEESLNESHMVRTMLPATHTSTPLMQTEAENPKPVRGRTRNAVNPTVAALIAEESTPNKNSPRTRRGDSESRTQDSQSVADADDPKSKRSRTRTVAKMTLKDDSKDLPSTAENISTAVEQSTEDDTSEAKKSSRAPTKRGRGKTDLLKAEPAIVEEVAPKRTRKLPAKLQNFDLDNVQTSIDTASKADPEVLPSRNRRGGKQKEEPSIPEVLILSSDNNTNDESEDVQKKPSKGRKPAAAKRPATRKKTAHVEEEGANEDDSSIAKKDKKDEEPVMESIESKEATTSRKRPLRSRK